MRAIVTFAVDVPEAEARQVTYADVLAWLQFNLGVTGGLVGPNPLASFPVEAVTGSVKVTL